MTNILDHAASVLADAVVEDGDAEGIDAEFGHGPRVVAHGFSRSRTRIMWVSPSAVLNSVGVA